MTDHVERFVGGEVLVRTPEARRLAAHLMKIGLSVTSGRDGIAVPPLARAVLAAFDATACETAAPAVAAVPQALGSSLLTPNLIGSREIAAMIGTHERNARDLCARGAFESAVKVGRSWFVDRDEVTRRSGTGT